MHNEFLADVLMRRHDLNPTPPEPEIKVIVAPMFEMAHAEMRERHLNPKKVRIVLRHGDVYRLQGLRCAEGEVLFCTSASRPLDPDLIEHVRAVLFR